MIRELETAVPPSKSVVGWFSTLLSVDGFSKQNKLFNSTETTKKRKVVEQDMEDEFSEENMQLLLRKAVAVLAAHLGFISSLLLDIEPLKYVIEKSHSEMESSVTYLISRIIAARIKRMCINLNLSHQRRVEGRETAFPSALMHALRLENIRDVTELQEFYRNRVIFYHDRVLLSCTQKYERAVKKFAPFQAEKI
ncbi:unnamed protein product [Brugia timori]|uniref:Component of oligomeric Golgi complex 3 n=1 Tax=Brugia timori TaxID=42155 RepID=A0A0R3QP60_9BILA|nr:unnamed protein product [Brugia timori]